MKHPIWVSIGIYDQINFAEPTVKEAVKKAVEGHEGVAMTEAGIKFHYHSHGPDVYLLKVQ